MNRRFTIAYAYPTSTNAALLGFSKTGCYYVEETCLREDSSIVTRIAQGCEGFESKDDADLLSLLREYKEPDIQRCG